MLWAGSRKGLPLKRSPRSCVSWRQSGAAVPTSPRDAQRAMKRSGTWSSPGRPHGLQGWSDAAIADLRDICSYIARDDPQAAHRIAWDVAFSTTFVSLAHSRSLAPPIREGREALCARLSLVPIESFTTYPKHPGASRSFMSGTVRARNRYFDSLPRPACSFASEGAI